MARPAVPAAYVDVRCSDCGTLRSVSARQATRAASLCPFCRSLLSRPGEPPDESDYRFWFGWAGVELNGSTAAEWVAEHGGLPAPLAELLRGLLGAREDAE